MTRDKCQASSPGAESRTAHAWGNGHKHEGSGVWGGRAGGCCSLLIQTEH